MGDVCGNELLDKYEFYREFGCKYDHNLSKQITCQVFPVFLLF